MSEENPVTHEKVNCDLCGKPFSSIYLSQHQRKAHDVRKRVFKSRNPTIVGLTSEDLGLDLILQTMFPTGIPPTKIPQVLAWVKLTEGLTSV